MLVLGKVIEVVSGQTYFDFVDEHVLTPAGAHDTGCFELDRVNRNLAVGYHKVHTEAGTMFENNLFSHVMRGGPQGGCYATVGDLHRFATALLAGKIVEPDLVTEFTTAKPELGSPGYGFGFGVSEDGKRFGHSGGFLGISAGLTVHRETGWIAVVLSNFSDGATPVRQQMARLIARAE